ncbi:MAG: hypothetical protein KKA07_11845 [Bacteroidetes bacterium]|nr:hypothetical protein [Bacteroidota bacterium]MBU1719750.1 hypothetical protein [Bacteroidota bacterium]
MKLKFTYLLIAFFSVTFFANAQTTTDPVIDISTKSDLVQSANGQATISFILNATQLQVTSIETKAREFSMVTDFQSFSSGQDKYRVNILLSTEADISLANKILSHCGIKYFVYQGETIEMDKLRYKVTD